jgi:hypothetical protein
MKAVAGIRHQHCMSEAWMPFQPAIDEPSKAWPSSNLSIRTADGHADVLFLAAGVGEAEINELDFLFLTIFITSWGSSSETLLRVNSNG